MLGVAAQTSQTGVALASVAKQATAVGDDPLALFADMMPVFSSPRCVNCHGATNPQTNTNHEGGQVNMPLNAQGDMTFDSSGACIECHTAAPASWRLAPRHMSLVGKDTLTLCRQMRNINNLADAGQRPVFVDHWHNDLLIGVAFVGQGGIGDESAFAPITPEPPSMSHAEFVAAAQRWTVDGQAACSNKWNGTITQTFTHEQKAQFTEVVTEARITIDVVENQATASVHWSMRNFTDVPTKDCATYVHYTFTADASKLPVDVQIFDSPTIPAGATPPELNLPPGFSLPPGLTLPPGTSLPPGITVPTFGEPGTIFIVFAGQAVPANQHTDTRSLPGCRVATQDGNHQYDLAGMMIQAKLDPSDPNHLAGQKVDQANGGKTVITWDLRRDTE
jgi:hypothetical protein